VIPHITPITSLQCDDPDDEAILVALIETLAADVGVCTEDE
jgi:hypothetical protein